MDFGVPDAPKGRCAMLLLAKWHWRGVADVFSRTQNGPDKKKRTQRRNQPPLRTRNGKQNTFCNLSFAKLEHSTTTIAALLLLAATFPDRQFNSAELCVSGIGRTSISQIKDAKDPFSLGNSRSSALMPWLCEASLDSSESEAFNLSTARHQTGSSQECHDSWAAGARSSGTPVGVWL